MIDIGEKGVAKAFPGWTGTELIQAMCDAALAIDPATKRPCEGPNQNPFLAASSFREGPLIASWVAVRFRDAANATLRELGRNGAWAPLPKSGFVSLGDVMENNVEAIRYTREHIFEHEDPESIWNAFVDYRLKVYSQAGESVYRLASHGLDLYEKAGESYVRVQRGHPDRIFLSELGRREATYKFWEFPDWTHLYYFNAEHIELRDIFLEHEFTPEQYEIKLRAFHREIGVDASEDAPTLQAQHVLKLPSDTKLLRVIQHVIQKHSDTPIAKYPKAATVADCLQAEFHLSRREAEAVDLVTRPDSLRGKG